MAGPVLWVMRMEQGPRPSPAQERASCMKAGGEGEGEKNSVPSSAGHYSGWMQVTMEKGQHRHPQATAGIDSE